MKFFTEYQERSLHEECGVFGVYNVKNASTLTYYGLHSLQHRGQEGCGIVSVNDEGILKRIKGEGLVSEIFNEDKLAALKGNKAIGHVRYATSGGGGIENVQPFQFKHHTGDFGLAHNGNLVNSNELRQFLEQQGTIFQSTSDSEILAHLIRKEKKDTNRINNIISALNMLEGAFTFVILTNNRLYACRDKYGLRPLSIAELDGGYIVSSETCAFEVIGAKFIRDVEPGEVIVIDDEGIKSYDYSKYKHRYMCAMEYIYFARPDSDIEGFNVHTFRKASGKALYKELPTKADIVIGVPDSSISAAIGYSEVSGIPYEMGLIKNKYVGRTFIQPSQELREKGVKMKLSAVTSIVKGKSIVLIDDSIVRGTTSKRIVQLLRDCGAKEVHVRIAAPQITSPCYYGVDMSTKEELISSVKNCDEVKEMIGADSLYFLSTDSLYTLLNRKELCLACFTNKYPTALYSSEKKEN